MVLAADGHLPLVESADDEGEDVMIRIVALTTPALLTMLAQAQPAEVDPGSNVDTRGYYRQPTLCGDTVVFVSEGDLWRVGISGASGGVHATRLTTHPGQEWSPKLSPDGQWVAFGGEYEGPAEVYVMPTAGGLPKRLTFEGSTVVGGRVGPRGWTPDGMVMYTTDRSSTLPNSQMYIIDPKSGARRAVPLAQVADGEFARGGSGAGSGGGPLWFVRIPFNGSHTKRYKGGTIEQIWRWSGKEGEEAVNLTGDYPGTSRRPMLFGGRVYFASDRDNTMNLWSMAQDGTDVKQVTTFKGMDVLGPSMDSSGKTSRVVFQNGADLYLTDAAAAGGAGAGGAVAKLDITLSSDLDQMRERWVSKPMEYATAVHPSPDGDRVVITARGQVFVVPAKQGRIVEVARREGREGSVRFREARFSHDGKSIIALSDESGEVEVWRWPSNGIGAGERLTKDAEVLRWTAIPSPDGKHIAHTDKHHRLWMYDVEKKSDTLVEHNPIEQIDSMTWSPDGRWLAYAAPTDNMYLVVKLWSADSGKVTQVTTDRFQSYSPSFSPSGEWLFFLSDRHLETVVSSPWGINQPDPFLDKTTKIYALALKPGLRWPYLPEDEIERAKKDAKKDEKKPEERPTEKPAEKAGEKAGDPAADKKDDKKDTKKPVEVVVDGIQSRLFEVPATSGNYSNLFSTDKALFFLAREAGASDASLKSYTITNDAPELKVVAEGVDAAELTQDGKKIMIRKGDATYVVDAGAGKADLEKKAVDLSGWRLSVVPREEFRQMYTESWRLLRDYFYDPKMHGVDWKAMHAKYLPLVERVRSRQELSDIMQQLTGELSALHHFVRDGDVREGPDKIGLSSLGCVLTRDEAAGGWVISKIYKSDPDEPARAAPVARPHVAANEGDVITAIDGLPTLSVADVNSLLRNKAGKQTLLTIRPAGKADASASREAIATPMTLAAEADLRYHEWEYTRRRMVEEMSGGEIGYLHLRAMGGDDWSDFVKGFYPVFHKKGLIIDVRHNRGGNIDSWVLSKLMRKAWMFWSQRTGQAPNWNMQYAFRGHMTMLVNERTASDGEAVAEGFKRLGLGKVIGTRTWGGEIWLSSSNVLVDKGIATAGEFGVWGPEGQWLIEGHGVEPDIVVDNLPHATFRGDDVQLRAAVDHLKKIIAENPIPAHARPEFPNKAEK